MPTFIFDVIILKGSDDEDEYCKYEVTEHSVAHARAVLKDIIEAEYGKDQRYSAYWYTEL